MVHTVVLGVVVHELLVVSVVGIFADVFCVFVVHFSGVVFGREDHLEVLGVDDVSLVCLEFVVSCGLAPQLPSINARSSQTVPSFSSHIPSSPSVHWTILSVHPLL
jgi:hypothetical protein